MSEQKDGKHLLGALLGGLARLVDAAAQTRRPESSDEPQAPQTRAGFSIRSLDGEALHESLRELATRLRQTRGAGDEAPAPEAVYRELRMEYFADGADWVVLIDAVCTAGLTPTVRVRGDLVEVELHAGLILRRGEVLLPVDVSQWTCSVDPRPTLTELRFRQP